MIQITQRDTRNTKQVMFILNIFLATLAIAVMASAQAQEPFGATVSNTNSSRAPSDTAGTDNAQAGNVTQLDVSGFTVTQAWAGYYGNVTGTIVLADSSDNQLYNWTLADPEGEVFAANQTVTWTDIQCYNFTATGTHDNTTDIPGGVSLNGTNLSQIEAYYNINASDVDGVDETFTLQHGGVGEHDPIFVASEEFTEGECISTRLYNSSEASASDQYEEVLLYDPAARIPVFTSIIEQGSVTGFNDDDLDFEMIVLEDGHGTDVATTTYNFYVELE